MRGLHRHPLANPKDQQAWIHVVYFEGNDADRTARIITSAANKPLTQIEVAEGYKRLRGFGWSAADIAAKVGKTAEHVQQLLAPGIITLGQINEALHFATVNAAQLAELGFQPLDNRAVCEGLPPEAAKPLRTARIYPADALPLIRAALLLRLAPNGAPATAAPCPPLRAQTPRRHRRRRNRLTTTLETP